MRGLVFLDVGCTPTTTCQRMYKIEDIDVGLRGSAEDIHCQHALHPVGGGRKEGGGREGGEMGGVREGGGKRRRRQGYGEGEAGSLLLLLTR